MNLNKLISARHRGNQFISTWRTTTANETITLPTPTNYNVNWGDGTVTTNTNSHVYAIAGDYEIKIRGEITDFRFNNTGDKEKILEVSNFGRLYLVNACFFGCENLNFIDDNFKALGISLGSAFRDCLKLNSPMYSLDTAGVVNLQVLLTEICQIG